MADNPFFEVRRLTKNLAGRPVVRNVSFCLNRGQTLALVGLSGAGKSTLARCLALWDPPDSGEVLLDGTLPRPAGGQIQLIPQQPAASLNPRFTVAQAIEEPLQIHHRGTPATRRREALRWMAIVGLPAAAAHARTGSLSGGEGQRVALARALVLEPKLLILDESLSGLDLSVRAQIAALLLDLRRERALTCILISHDLALAAQLADEIAVMDEGAIVEQAAAGELLASPRHIRSRELVAAARELSLFNASPSTVPAGIAHAPAVEVAHALLRAAPALLPTRTPPEDDLHTSPPARAPWAKFLALRLLHGLILLGVISFLSFVLSQMAGGDFYSEMRNDPRVSPATIAGLRREAGLDRPLLMRYGQWIHSSLGGDFGYSLAYRSPVAPLLGERVQATLLLTGTATLLAWLIALPLGIWNASHRGTWPGSAARSLTAIWLAVPDLLLALTLLALAAQTGWFPVGGNHLALPAAVLVLGLAPALVRHVSASLGEAMDSPFALSARAQGIPRRRRLYRHLLPAAMNPLVSLFGFSVGTLLSASLLVEVVTGWPGLGPLFVEAIMARDFAIVLAVVMLSAIFLLAGNLLADLLLYRLDPRIRTVDR